MAQDRLTADGRRLQSAIASLQRLHVKVGYQQGQFSEDDGEGNEVDLCDIAMWNELGTSKIPARPFLSNSIDKHETEITAFVEQCFSQLLSGTINEEEMLKKIGVYLKGVVQKEIVDGDYAPNAESTIKRKKSDRPLIDSGYMRQSVSFFITPKGGEDDE